MIQSLGPYLLSALQTAAAFVLASTARILHSTIVAHAGRITLGNNRGPRFRGVTIMPYGRGDDNSTFDYRLYGVRRVMVKDSNGGEMGLDCSIHLLASGTCTLSTFTGVATGLLGTTDRHCDTITFTATALLTYLAGVFGVSPSYFSPTGNTPGEISIPECYNFAELIFETKVNANCTHAGALIEKYV